MNHSSPIDVAELLAVHLHDEKAVLETALPMLRAVKAALTGGEILLGVIEQQQTIVGILEQIKVRRDRFRGEMARRLPDLEPITVGKLLRLVSARRQRELAALAEDVRRMSEEFVTLMRWLSIHVRIHLDAYSRLLGDLTGGQSSGRYGPQGRTEAGDYRPLLTIQG